MDDHLCIPSSSASRPVEKRMRIHPADEELVQGMDSLASSSVITIVSIVSVLAFLFKDRDAAICLGTLVYLYLDIIQQLVRSALRACHNWLRQHEYWNTLSDCLRRLHANKIRSCIRSSLSPRRLHALQVSFGSSVCIRQFRRTDQPITSHTGRTEIFRVHNHTHAYKLSQTFENKQKPPADKIIRKWRSLLRKPIVPGTAIRHFLRFRRHRKGGTAKESGE